MLSNLQDEIVNWTVKNSGYDQQRSYIGLSGIADCDQEIYDRYVSGNPGTVGAHLLTKISYELEQDLIERLRAMRLYREGGEISLFDGLVRGHPDGFVNGDLLEIKTVACEDHFPRNGRLSRRVYWQVQAYLKYTSTTRAQVVYLARESGALCVFQIGRNERAGDAIAEKIERMVKACRELQRPDCSCGGIGRHAAGRGR